jgi:hypothetical protein
METPSKTEGWGTTRVGRVVVAGVVPVSRARGCTSRGRLLPGGVQGYAEALLLFETMVVVGHESFRKRVNTTEEVGLAAFWATNAAWSRGVVHRAIRMASARCYAYTETPNTMSGVC